MTCHACSKWVSVQKTTILLKLQWHTTIKDSKTPTLSDKWDKNDTLLSLSTENSLGKPDANIFASLVHTCTISKYSNLPVISKLAELASCFQNTSAWIWKAVCLVDLLQACVFVWVNEQKQYTFKQTHTMEEQTSLNNSSKVEKSWNPSYTYSGKSIIKQCLHRLSTYHWNYLYKNNIPNPW